MRFDRKFQFCSRNILSMLYICLSGSSLKSLHKGIHAVSLIIAPSVRKNDPIPRRFLSIFRLQSKFRSFKRPTISGSQSSFWTNRPIGIGLCLQSKTIDEGGVCNWRIGELRTLARSKVLDRWCEKGWRLLEHETDAKEPEFDDVKEAVLDAVRSVDKWNLFLDWQQDQRDGPV